MEIGNLSRPTLIQEIELIINNLMVPLFYKTYQKEGHRATEQPDSITGLLMPACDCLSDLFYKKEEP